MAKVIKPKFIVLDSNVLIGDYWLRSPSFVLLREFLNRTKADLVVPKIVFDEVVNHHKEDLKELKSATRKLLGKAGRLLRDFEEDWVKTISKTATDNPYRQFLSKALDALNAKIPDYKDISHLDIVSRDLDRRRPFQQSGKGYRDTLLWETIARQCIHKDALTVFVTDNVRDFCDSDGELHSDLRRDLMAKGHYVDQVALSRDLPSLTDTYIVPYLVERKDFATLIEHGKFGGLNLEEVSQDNSDSLVKAIDDSPWVMIEEAGTYEPSVDVIDQLSDFQVEQVSEVKAGILLVIYQFLADVAFTYFLPHNEYYCMGEEESAKIGILDHNWNDYVMRVESHTDVVVKCRLTFNAGKKKVESFEVEEVTESFEVEEVTPGDV